MHQLLSALSYKSVAFLMLSGLAYAEHARAEPHKTLLNLMSVNNEIEMKRAVCMNSGASSKLLIAKMDVVKNTKGVQCPTGIAAIRYREDISDPGHVLVNIDPPKGNNKGLDCDGKADLGLTYIGLNCLAVDLESTSHRMN